MEHVGYMPLCVINAYEKFIGLVQFPFNPKFPHIPFKHLIKHNGMYPTCSIMYGYHNLQNDLVDLQYGDGGFCSMGL